MRLLLRAQDIAWTTFGLGDDKGKVIKAHRLDSRPETILNRLMETLSVWEVTMDKIDSLAVVAGTGSFTALRSGLTIANTLSFVRGVPTASIVVKQDVDDEVVLTRLAKAKVKRGAWSVPTYGAKPMITKPKSVKVATP